MDVAGWAAAAGAALVGWLALAAVGLVLSRWRVHARRGRVVLWIYLVGCGVGGMAGVANDVSDALTRGIPMGNAAQEMLVFGGFALLWPYLLLFALAVWLWGGHG